MTEDICQEYKTNDEIYESITINKRITTNQTQRIQVRHLSSKQLNYVNLKHYVRGYALLQRKQLEV